METLAYLHLALAYEETRDAVSPDLGEMLESLNPTKETLLGEKLKFVSKLNWRSLCPFAENVGAPLVGALPRVMSPTRGAMNVFTARSQTQ